MRILTRISPALAAAVVAASLFAPTAGIGHSFAVRQVTRNRPGADRIRYRAVRLATGQACTGRVTL